MESQPGKGDSGRLENLEHRLDLMEIRQTTVERSRQVMHVMMPPETRRHVRAAWRENLLAVRSLIDSWIDRLDDKPAADADDDGRETIPID